MPENKLDLGDWIALERGIVGLITIIFGLSLAGYWVTISRYIELTGFWSWILGLTNTQIAVLSLLVGIIYIYTGYLLWHRYKEGKWIASILAVFEIFVFPIGTFALALPTLYTLYASDIKNEWTKTIEI